jgi:parvulin-like peptidyl-prolyl isomerase
MRENTKWIMLVTALAFVALMVFEWGMDITGRSGLGVGEIGRVNGEAVSYDDYNLSYRRLYDQIQASQEEPVTSQQVSEIEDAAWDDVVNQTLIRQELRRRGIEVTVEEVRQAARFSPPPEFRTNPAFQTDGVFDIQKYQTFISDPNVDNNLLLALEGYYRDVIPRGKLLRQVSADVYLTDASLWQSYRDQSEQIEVRYIPVNPLQRFADSLVSVEDDEVERYYDRNRDEFAVPAQASVKVVVLDKSPTAADSAAGEAVAADLRQRVLDEELTWQDINSREDLAAFVEELGWFGRDRMVEEFSDAAFAARVGQLTEPVRSGFGWHVIDVQDRDADSIRARHILVPHARTNESELALLIQADSLEELGENRTIDEAAETLGLSVQAATLNTEFAFVAVAGQVSEGADWAFEEAEVGDVSPVFETRQAFYMLELLSVQPEGFLTLDEASPSIKQTLRLEKKLALARDEAGEVVDEIRGGRRFEDVADERGLEIRAAGPFSRVDFVPGLGRANAAVGAGFGLNEGEVSDAVEANNGVFVLQLVSFIPADSVQWAEDVESQRAFALGSLQQTRLQDWLEGLRASADIVDRRDEVLNQDPADQQVQMPLVF